MKTAIKGLMFFVFAQFQADLQAQPQLESGVWSLSGIAAYSSMSAVSSSGFTTDQTHYAFHPGLSYFLLEGLEARLSIDLDIVRSVYGPPTFYISAPPKHYTYGILLGVRKYFAVAQEYSPFLGGSVGPSWLRIVQSGYPTLATKPQWTSKVEAGVDLFFSSSFAFEPSISYSRMKLFEQTKSITELGFGIRYFFLQ